uniref:Uncharacterized protein n=1 Tax=Arundo donax TaxID=35708 RepID=A0A0A8YMS9_ARUDO
MVIASFYVFQFNQAGKDNALVGSRLQVKVEKKSIANFKVEVYN